MTAFSRLRVIEVAEGVAGPACGLYFADLGAEVIKIEPPEGDRARGWGPPMIGDDAAVFVHLNRGKHSVIVDPDSPADQDRFHELVAEADVVILHRDDGGRGLLEAETLVARYPSLIVCHISDFGAVGPMSAAAGSELTSQAMSGLTRYVSQPNGPPLRVGFETAGMATSMHGFQAIVAALWQRAEFGGGQVVRVSQLGSLISLKTIQIAAQSGFDEFNGFHLNGPQWPPDNGWRAADGATSFEFRRTNRDSWVRFCKRVGLEHLTTDPAFERWDLTLDMGERRYDLGRAYEPVLAKLTTDEITELVADCGGTAVRYHDYAEVLAHPQTKTLKPLIETADTRPGAQWQLGLPFKLFGVPPVNRPSAAPALGENRIQAKRKLPPALLPRTRRPPEGLPLAGIKVVDASIAAVGPWAGAMLGMLGADVIKVEPPIGDLMRNVMPTTNGLSTSYLAMNVNKRGVMLDAKKPEEMREILRLVAEADIFIQNFRPGVAERIGLGREALSALNPRLIYGEVSGFGWTGPLAAVGAIDPHMQAFVGACSVNGVENEPPQRWRLFGYFDLSTSLSLTMGILTALWERRESGLGRHLQVTMIEAGIAMQRVRIAEHLAGGRPRPMGSGTTYLVPDQAFATQDRPLCVSATSEKQWRALCAELGEPELATDPRFATNAARVEHRGKLLPRLAARFATRPVSYWLRRLGRARVPCSLFMSFADFRYHAQYLANDMMAEIDTPHGPLTVGGPPWAFDSGPIVVESGPTPGQHNDRLASGLWRKADGESR